jgi:O-antigen ligase
MVLALMMSTSRSGIIGLAGAAIVCQWLTRGRHAGATRRWIMLEAVFLVIVLWSFADVDALMNRVDETLMPAKAARGRHAIWHDAARISRDFPLTGTGAGTFGAAIVAYQTAEPEYSIGQAHNQYLQIAAEGGALVAVPLGFALTAFLLLFRKRLQQDLSSTFLIRAGAGAGMAGAMLQSFWETGLRMPANAMLFAVLAAIATHPAAVSATDRQAH